MDALNILVLPALALLVFITCAVMAWLLFRPAPIRKARSASVAAPQKPKKRAL